MLRAPAGAEGLQDEGLYLHVLDVAVTPGVEYPELLSGPIGVDLVVSNAARLTRELKRTGQPIVETSGDRVRIIVADAPTFLDEPAPQHLAASFVIDYGEPDIAILVEALREQHGDNPDPETLREFVYELIPAKESRTFDLASQVARERNGDCTEHGVLLTALARAFGLPARYVTGIVLVARKDSFDGFGHAWTEVYDGERWNVTDATMPERIVDDAVVRYIPLHQLETEGVNYGMGMLGMAMVLPRRLENISPADLPE